MSEGLNKKNSLKGLKVTQSVFFNIKPPKSCYLKNLYFK